MNIYDLLQNNAGVNITISAGQLADAIDYCVQKTREELQREITDANNDVYVSPDQLARAISVDRSTLWRWAKQGYLVPISIGGKRRYSMSSVRKLMEGQL